ncbi:hypothetical protein MSAN_01886900 [Mycena sanguinolenta]|uniref:Uncharacterized protein n=1 Tax=Mycena sanguinolenta TaxID=230812 RepID=A0A8H7CSG6_9AGAR|nr:hypothetical protein MSAN_01886900 [Mycena sanguinolenta]
MGKSAKLHKRTPKSSKKPSTSASSSAAAAVVGGPKVQAQSAKKKAGLKQKAASTGTGDVLRSADYVSLMMGSRKKVREEAAKMPKSQ